MLLEGIPGKIFTVLGFRVFSVFRVKGFRVSGFQGLGFRVLRF
jgi:hypothetical protein